MTFEITKIEAIDIPDAWFQCINAILDTGFKYVIQHGTFVGQTRMEFDHITIYIKSPYAEPYDLMLPVMPEGSTTPAPVTNGYVEQYLPYLMTSAIGDNEQYTYGSRMVAAEKPIIVYDPPGVSGCAPEERIGYLRHNQIEHFIELLKETPNTNQAILQIAQPLDYQLNDPPCLRHIDMRIKDNQLIFYPYFRSWDLWGGFPANLAGIAVLQKYMADHIGVEAGPMCASSKGLHIYDYAEELSKLRCNK